ncbi:aminodeoxychorismate lyase [Shewanella sp. Isolate11]|uniref:aminodeoxychorismate lyase n=1 Tax=Shewanella sp. Isolate11 TaxID=2908530 RepID=UPI001EFD6557|nr:aminodeoxychorismate lyase [Shewanella sp. Isolate11]MCG9696997.1 aminodeoxychorismate lyase [Shewanella sp. Isolate11]
MSIDVWVNGIAQDSVSAFDRGLAYGDGLFATMRCSKQGVLFLDVHLARLAQSAQRLGIEWQPSSELLGLIQQVAERYVADGGHDGCIKLLLSRGVGGRGYLPPNDALITEVLSVHDIPAHYRDWQAQGITLQSNPVQLSRQPRLAGMKHLNRLEQVLLRSEPLNQDFDDWLVLDCQGNLVESSMANIFFIKGKTVVTPAQSHSGVAGVMREQLFYYLIESGFNLECRDIAYAELTQFEQALISNSLFGVVAIKRIDQIQYAMSDISRKIQTDLSLSL